MFPPLTPVVKNLLIINIAAFLASMVMPALMEYGAMHYFTSNAFQPYQIVTYMFLHGGMMHIFFNMFALMSLGILIEQFLGDKKFIFLYMICGIGAGIIYNVVNYIQVAPLLDAVQLASSDFTHTNFSAALQKLVNAGLVTEHGRELFSVYLAEPTMTDEQIAESLAFLEKVESLIRSSNGTMVGASGAVYGVLASVALYFPNSKMQIMFIPYPIKAKYLVMGLAAISLYFTLNPSEGDRVAHLAHLAGMVPAIILYFVWKKDKNSFY